MERIEDRSKALSYIGIEVADALKLIPTPQDLSEIEEIHEEEAVQTKQEVKEKKKKQAVSPIIQTADEFEQNNQTQENTMVDENYYESTRVNVKTSLWQRFKQSKFVRTIKYIMKIKIVLDVPALPSADDERR